MRAFVSAAGVSMEPDQSESLLECIDQIKSRDRSEFSGRQFVAHHFNRDRLAGQMLEVLNATSERRRAA